MSVDISQFYQVFFEESLEGLDNMESALMALDTDNIDAETINTIFRAAHSIKGGSATFGFSEVASFTHVLETLLDEVREGSRGLAPDHVDLLLRSVDAMRNMIETLQAGETIDTSGSDELKVQFEAILSGGEAPAESAAESATDESKEASNAGWKIEFAPHPDMLRTGNEPIRMFRELGELGDLSVDCHTHKLPTFDALSPEECHLSWTLTLLGDVSIDDVKEVFEWVEDEADISYHPLAQSEGPVADYIENAVAEGGADQVVAAAEGANQAMISDMLDASGDSKPAVVTALADRAAGKAETQVEPAKPAAKAPVKPAAKPAAESSIRVGTDKIDQLINLVGELVITQSMLGQLGEGDSEDFTQEKLLRLQEGLSQLEQNTRELQESVMRIRMLPISFSFSRFPRMVRDLSQRLNKKINLVLQGEQTELDKTVMEKIGDPLVHLVRNSVDHGIESPDVRKAAGKPETGVVTLNAYHQGGNVVIEIRDDGAGLNKDRILAKAHENGLVNPADNLSDEQIFDLIFQPGFSTAKEVSAETPVAAKPAPKAVPKAPAKEAAAPVETTVRVDTQRLDDIMNMVGELVLVRNRLVRLGISSSDEEMAKAVANLDVVTGDLQTSVMKTRMQPIKKVFGRFPRVVRDLARSLRKEITLELVGEETDLDKNLVEALADPLVHLVRNSVDHGIEAPDVREKAGKNRMGTIVLAAEQEGDHILLSITDDGGGMDPDKLRAIAVEKGLYDEETVARLTDTEAYNLIFMPGFSTKKEISDVSGRGVGMDVVKTKITQLNGSLEINSELGVGTRINIKVPLTLAIMPTLMIMLGQQTFALPLVSVNEIFHMDLRKTNFVDGREVINIRNNSVPLFFLKRWLLKRGLLSEESANDDPYAHVVIVTVGTQRVGFVVDQLIGQEEVVIKPLGKMLQGTPGMSGATITGDGRIALILDVPGLLKRYA